jgi:sec-independent protein translocase protein TatA
MLAEIFGVDAIIVVVVVAVVLFGGSQIPKLARSLGTARSEFKKGLTDPDASGSDAHARTEGSA